MANHCVYDKCFECGGEYCLRGCGYTCKCGKEAEDPQKKIDERKAMEKIAESFPDGWF